MIPLDFVTEFVHEYFEKVRVSKNGTHFLARCSLCGDSRKSKAKRRFNLDYNNGNPIFHCFNDGCTSGSFLTLYSILKGISISQSIKELQKYDSDYLIQRLSNRKRDKVVKEIGYEYHDYILKDCVSLNDPSDGYIKSKYRKSLKNFINNRKLSSGDVFAAYKGDYQGRFIIPIYNEYEHIVYFQARAIDKNTLPKYKNPTLMKGSIIYNKHKFDKSKYIIVCEGLIDAISIGNQGTSCLGGNISEDFLKEVLSLTEKGIIICLDNDEAGYSFMLDFMKENNSIESIRFFLFPYKYRECDDINSYKVLTGSSDIYGFVVINSYSKTAAYAKIKMESWRLDEKR